MYQALLYIHSWNRWFLLIFMVLAVVKSLSGWLGNKPFEKSDNTIAIFLIATLHIQLIVGLLLQFVYSPMATGLMANMGPEVMKDKAARFWAVEHLVAMVIAVVVAQVGRIVSKKKTLDRKKHQMSFAFYGVAVLIVIAHIPWGVIREARPLFRLPG